jgi:multidrug efflux pump subunit AcrB
MKGGMGLIGLLVAVLIIGLLAKKQLGSTGQLAAPQAAVSGVAMPTTTPGATVKEQSQQIQQQVKQQVEAAMQAPPRKEPDEK